MAQENQARFKDIASVLHTIGFPVNEIRYLASGDDSTALLCDETYVVKLPKRKEVEAAQQREFALYGFLQRQRLPFRTPEVLYQSSKLNIMSYLSGEKISLREYMGFSETEREALASDEARFLHALHDLPVDIRDTPFCDAVEDKRHEYLQDHTVICKILSQKNLMRPVLRDKIDAIYEALLANCKAFQYNPCLTHNDFSSGNLIYRKKRLYGVIDFGDFVVGDPDNDFLCILDCSEDDFGKDFGRKVLRYYGHSHPEIAERKAEINDAYWPLQQIVLGVRRNDTAMVHRGYDQLQSSDPKAFLF